MEVVFDTVALTLFLKPSAKPPNDPSTNLPVTHAAARIENAVEQLSKAQKRIVIPATAWAEFLVCADDSAQDYIDKIKERASVEVVAFDSISAIEAAIDQRKALKRGNAQANLTGLSGTRQCVKADRQVVAVAKTRKADAVYSGDRDIQKICETMGVAFIGIWDLEIPASTTPLLDKAEADAAAEITDPSTETAPPSGQSPAAEQASSTAPAPARPAVPQDAQELPPPGSSPGEPPPSRSGQ